MDSASSITIRDVKPRGDTTSADISGALQARALSRCLDLPVLGGNRVALLDETTSAYAEILGAVDGAVDHVNVETGLFDLETHGDELVARLRARMRRGVRVHVLYERSRGSAERLDGLRRAGARLSAFDPTPHDSSWWSVIEPPLREARRQVVIDGRLAYLGGLGSSRRRAGAGAPERRASDRLVRIEGPVVAELQWLFIDQWEHMAIAPMAAARYFPPLPWVGSQRVGVAASPPDDAGSPLRRALLAALQAAQQSVLLVGTRGMPGRAVQGALGAAAGRGLDVHLLWSSWRYGGLARLESQAQARALAREGVRVHELHDGPLTARTSVIDGVWSCVGSGDGAGLEPRGGDTTLIVLDGLFAECAASAFFADAVRCRAAPRLPDGPLAVWQRLNGRLSGQRGGSAHGGMHR